MLKGFDWGSWGYGLVAAVLGGGASAAVGALGLNSTDPQHFSAQTAAFWKQVALQFSMGAALSFFLYLKKTAEDIRTKIQVGGTKTVTMPSGEITATVFQKTITVEGAANLDTPKNDTPQKTRHDASLSAEGSSSEESVRKPQPEQR